MRYLYNCLLAGITLLTATHGLCAQDTINVPCNGDTVSATYCYVNNDDHTWYWHSECPDEPVIFLQFTSGTIESSDYDHLTIYDGGNATAPILFQNWNSPEDLDLAGLQFVNAGGWEDMYMEMTSNATNCCATGGLLGGGLTEWVFSASNGAGTTEIREERAGDLTVYPNPASNELNVRLSNQMNGPAEIQMLDVSGRVVYQSSFAATGAELMTFDLHGLQSGTYSVVLNTPNSVKTQRLQVIH